jgi:hypothetical protein
MKVGFLRASRECWSASDGRKNTRVDHSTSNRPFKMWFDKSDFIECRFHRKSRRSRTCRRTRLQACSAETKAQPSGKYMRLSVSGRKGANPAFCV